MNGDQEVQAQIIYAQLRFAVAKANQKLKVDHYINIDSLIELAFLLGAVDALRKVNGFSVPEVEDAFLILRQYYSKGGLETCLPTY